MMENTPVLRRRSTESKAIEFSEDTDTLLKCNNIITKQPNNASESETDANLEADNNEMASCMYNHNIPQDIYSLIIRPSPMNVYITVFFIFLFQILVLSLMLYDLTTGHPNGSPPLNAPAGISDSVRISQFLAIFIAIALQEDIITSLNMITLFGVMKDAPVLTAWKYSYQVSPILYIASSICRIIVGFITLVVSFIIIVQSSKTIQLFAEFSAMAFVSSIDNIIFTLACNGYFSEKVEKQANAMKTFSMRTLSKPAYWVRRTVLFLLSLMLTTAWVVITIQQRRGDFVCKKITIEMSHDIDDWYHNFNGVYIKSDQLFHGRVVYYEENYRPDFIDSGANYRPNLGFTGAARFQYCEYIGKWIFASPHNETASYDDWWCGIHYTLLSPRTDEYDLMAVNPSDWVIWDGKQASFERYFCNECNNYLDCNGGQCHNKSCDCSGATYYHKNDFSGALSFGPRCNLVIECGHIIVKNATSFGDSYCKSSSTYSLLKSDAREILVYGRPVYTKDCFNAKERRIAMSYVMFVGNRWMISRTNETEDKLITYMNTFHADSAWNSDFESLHTASGSPVGTKWISHQEEHYGEEVSDSFICSLNCTYNGCGQDEGSGECITEPYEFCECNYNDTHFYYGEYCENSDVPQRNPLTTYNEEN